MKQLPLALIATAALLAIPAAAVAQDPGEDRALPGLEDLDEGWNTLKPGGETVCAHGTDYEFYARAGDPEHVLVYLYGGGACWNAELCQEGIGSYASEIMPTQHPSHLGGILDQDHPENPFAGYTMVGIPVCTGDVHLGDRDAVYTLEGEGGERTEFTVHHRGLTNTLSAIDWITSNVESPKKIFVGGGSAGGLGLPFHASLLARKYPDAAVAGLGDSASSYGVDALSAVDSDRWGVPAVLHGYSGWETVGFTSIAELFVTGGHAAHNLSLYQIDLGRDEVQQGWLWLTTGDPEPDVLRNIEDNQAEIRSQLPGFRSLTLGGAFHVILPNSALFYRSHMDGRSVRDWVTAIADGAPVTDVECGDCFRTGFIYDEDDLAIMDTTIDLLTESGWNPEDQGRPCPEKAEALNLRCALVPAVGRVSGNPPFMHAAVLEVVNEAAARSGYAPGQPSFLRYNNDPGRTVEDVVDMLEEIRERIWRQLNEDWRSAAPAGAGDPSPLALINATVVDPARGVHQAGMTVLIEGERIGAVFPNGTATLPEGAQVIDLEGRYLIPGLIESHTHLSNVFRQISISPGPLDPPSRETMYWVLERMLYGGVVAARDMAGDGRIFGKAAHNILTGERKGPDVYYAAVMGGRHFMTNDSRVAWSSLGYPPGEAPWLQTVEPGDDPALKVARAAGTGASAIKFYIGVEAELIQALVEQAHRRGLKVWAHAVVFPARPIDVVRAGVDVISHTCGLSFQDASLNPADFPEVTAENRPRIDPDQIDPDSPEMAALFQEMVRRGTVFDATLYHHSRPGGSGIGCTPELAIALVSAAHRAGVIISAGTDTYAPEDDEYPGLHLELERLVDSGVMTPTEALVAGTFNGALALGREDDYGTIEPGKLASLVVLEGDPTVDIRALRTVEAVIKRGRIHPRAEYTTGLRREDRQASDTAGTDPYPEVRAAQAAMAEAMAAADCDGVAGFFADGFTFYARGRHLESRETVVARCLQVPRPFPEMHHLVDEIQVLSGTRALALQVMELHREESGWIPRREVITRLWTRGDDGRWRIAHMHVSLDEMPDP